MPRFFAGLERATIPGTRGDAAGGKVTSRRFTDAIGQLVLSFGLTIFVSAFLLFQVQPLIGRSVLPWFGGTPAVWTGCMLVFQVLLLLGYLYAHLMSTHLRLRAQISVHLLVVCASLALLPVGVREAWRPIGSEAATWKIAEILLRAVGLPYFLLATTGPQLQHWIAGLNLRRPYRYYALSNVASLLALVSYPFVFEPALSIRSQTTVWSATYLVFVAGSVLCGIIAYRGDANRRAESVVRRAPPEPVEAERRPGAGALLVWLVLGALGSVMLLATTNRICQDIAVVPFLWVAPLATYLLTFVICFDRERWYAPGWFALLLVACVTAVVLIFLFGFPAPLSVQIGVFLLTLFVACMICHGELVRRKPAPCYLTWFYLALAAGGAAGGLLVAVGAPLLFDGYWEYHLGLAGCCLAAGWSVRRDARWAASPRRRLLLLVGLGEACLAVGVALALNAAGVPSGDELREGVTITTTRNFYGVLRVIEKNSGDGGRSTFLLHGRVIHGRQFRDPVRRRWPTTYYGRESGVALALERHPLRGVATGGRLRVGVIGLGAGTLAAYGRSGDHIRFYEINPEVTRLARDHFTYLNDCPARVEVLEGDARLRMENELAAEKPQRYDVLVVDAFSGDAIPIHLLTEECAAIYFRHLAPDGILAVHISNQHLNLRPVVRGLADTFGRTAVLIASRTVDAARGTMAADWMLVTSNPTFLSDPRMQQALRKRDGRTAPPLRWTDDFASIWHLRRF